jgi:hypothetical protein
VIDEPLRDQVMQADMPRIWREIFLQILGAA